MSATIEEIRERKRLYMAKKRASDPEAARAYHRERHKKNREHNVAKMRAYYARRFFWGRAMKLRGSHRATASDLASIWKQQRGRCALTGRRLDRSAQLDHIVARARGGSDSKSNLRWLCRDANLARRELSDEEFVRLCEDVMAWIGKRIQMVSSIGQHWTIGPERPGEPRQSSRSDDGEGFGHSIERPREEQG